eukprot:Hpha_TRINITY_DN17358_c0_g1::TRINITY_DN17358_c0_g1_i1::g.138044::m.138044
MRSLLLGGVAALSLALPSACTTPLPAAYPQPPVTLRVTPASLTVENGFLSVVLSLTNPAITALKADFHGGGSYGPGNLLAAPFALQREAVGAGGAHTTFSSADGAGVDLRAAVLRNDTSCAMVRVSGVVDNVAAPVVSAEWTLSLCRGDRTLGFNISTVAVATAEVVAVRHMLPLSSPSLYALFPARGVAQMMANPGATLGSIEEMSRVYALGGQSSLDVLLHRVQVSAPTPPSGTPAASLLGSGHVLQSVTASFAASWQLVMAGLAHFPPASFDDWSRAGWANTTNTTRLPKGATMTAALRLGGNNFDFPVAALPHSSEETLPFADLRAFMTGVFASPVGCFKSYIQGRRGEIAPTIAHPDTGYNPNTNFFDPDSYLSLSAVMYSGDAALQVEARLVLEKSMGVMQADGQLPHHFEGARPTYESIAGSTQTGPNIFWLLCCLQYAKLTGDFAWLRAHQAKLELALEYLLALIDRKEGMLSVPGPLWIDVLVRENYTSDSNAIMPLLLEEMAVAEEVVFQNATYAKALRATADGIAGVMNARLWSAKEDDHYVTQLNPDGSTRDFVDYDSNLLAVAFGVAPADRAARILARVDRGNCTHIRATWASEKPYDGQDDCYIKGGSVCGDSVVTLGRIGWADALARLRVSDMDTLRHIILAPIESDLVERTWLYERYDCAGGGIRTPYYFEYPSVYAMLLREVVHGVNLHLDVVSVAPLTPPLHWHLGDVHVDLYATAHPPGGIALRLRVPGSGTRSFEVGSLAPTTVYTAAFAGTCRTSPSPATLATDAYGVLPAFRGPVGPQCTLTLSVVGHAAGGAGGDGRPRGARVPAARAANPFRRYRTAVV